jgi:predicted branched-subunit amino acid permease
MRKEYQDFIAGARGALPILPGVVPFALICSVSAIGVGLNPVQAAGMSFVMFAGASQLAILQLLGEGAHWVVMLVTAWIINIRFTMYSASLAPYLKDEPNRRRMPFVYVLSDQAFGVSMAQFAKEIPAYPAFYFYGAAGTIAATWLVSAIIGAAVGTVVPASWGFEFAFPLSFMALMFAAIKDKPGIVAAVVGGSVAVLLKLLPYNIGLIIAASLGIAAGMLVENRLERQAA